MLKYLRIFPPLPLPTLPADASQVIGMHVYILAMSTWDQPKTTKWSGTDGRVLWKFLSWWMKSLEG